MSFRVYNVQTVDNWVIKCVTDKQSSALWSTETPINCLFVPNKDYPDLSQIQITMTGSTWFDNYDEFVPKFERLFVDLIFIILIFWFFIWLYKIVKKVFF